MPEETLEDIKRLVAGDLGFELERYPMRFTTAAFFGPSPSRDRPLAVSSGSASLILLEGEPHALTCWHVLEGYRSMLEADGRCNFQLGDCKLDPLAQLVDEDRRLDVAVIRLSNDQAKEITSGNSEFGNCFVEPPTWPPGHIAEGDFVAFGGFPGELRRELAFNTLSFGSYSSGGSRVTQAREDYIVCQFEREHWVVHEREPAPERIRGMSGGPAFAIRRSPGAGIITFEFIGVIFEFSEDYELLYIRLANVLRPDGHIMR